MSKTQRFLISVLAVTAIATTLSFAATPTPAPPPAPKQQVVVTQEPGINPPLTLGTLPWSLSGLNLRQQSNGLMRLQTPNGANFVQWSITNGDVTVHYQNVSVCPPMPAPLTQTVQCPAGTNGTWTQTATFAAAKPQVPPNQCWVQGPWLPTIAPAGTCTTAPPPGGLTLDFSFVDRTSQKYADFIAAANRTDEIDTWTVMYAYYITGQQQYCDRAVPAINASMTVANIEFDGFHYIGETLGPMSMALARCPNVTAAQKSAWTSLANSELNKLWNCIGWSCWGVDFYFNNYQTYFVLAQVFWGLASQDPAQLALARTKLTDTVGQLATHIPGGASLEGTGYQYTYKNLALALVAWRDSGQGDLVDGYTGNSALAWVHATVPTMDAYAPYGTQSRYPYPYLFDYQRASAAVSQQISHDANVKAQAGWWLCHIDLQNMERWQDDYDNLWAYPCPSSPPPLTFRAAEVGEAFARTAWTDDAIWWSSLYGEFSESHAHAEQGAFMLYGKGVWLSVTNNIYSNSGTHGEAAGWDSIDKNVVLFRRNGAQVKPIYDTSATVSNYTANAATGETHITGDLSSYMGNGITWRRTQDFVGGALTINDTTVLPSGVTAKEQVNTPVQPSCHSGGCTAGLLILTITTPANVTPSIIDMRTQGDFNSGWRIDWPITTGSQYRLSTP